MFKAKFKTAYLQRELAESALVAANMTLGEMVVVTPATEHIPVIVKPLVAETEGAAKAEANAFLAQSDMTLDYGHVPVEDRDYRYSPTVKATHTSIGKGLFETTTARDAALTAPSNNDVCYVYDSTSGLFLKYTYSSGSSSWSAGASAADYVYVDFANEVKSVAYFNIMDVEDLVIYTVS